MFYFGVGRSVLRREGAHLLDQVQDDGAQVPAVLCGNAALPLVAGATLDDLLSNLSSVCEQKLLMEVWTCCGSFCNMRISFMMP